MNKHPDIWNSSQRQAMQALALTQWQFRSPQMGAPQSAPVPADHAAYQIGPWAFLLGFELTAAPPRWLLDMTQYLGLAFQPTPLKTAPPSAQSLIDLRVFPARLTADEKQRLWQLVRDVLAEQK